MRTVFYAVLMSFGLSACSSTPKTAEEFWLGQGERFGSHGYAFDNASLPDIKEKVPFDENAYKEGYEKGKLEYCDPYKAFEKGIKGTRYTGQCEGMLQDVMVEVEWRRGFDAFMGADFYKF